MKAPFLKPITRYVVDPEKLAEWRESCGISRETLSEYTFLNPSYIRRLETADNVVDANIAVDLEDAFQQFKRVKE